MPPTPFEYEKQRSPVVRIGLALGAVAAIAVGIVLVRQMASGDKPARRSETVMVAINPLPPPPPPPPPPAVPPQRVEEQTQVTEQDMKPPEQAPEAPSPSLGTGVTGNGPADGFGLGGKDRGQITGTGARGGGGSRFGAYFSQVVQAVTVALGRNPATRNAKFDVRVRVWSDPTGRVNRVRLLQSTGEPELDRVIGTEALIGCQLPDIPAGMRLPLELRLNLRRPD
jgi:protein TonB